MYSGREVQLSTHFAINCNRYWSPVAPSSEKRMYSGREVQLSTHFAINCNRYWSPVAPSSEKNDVLRTGGTTFHAFRNQLQQVLESGCAIVGEKGFLPSHLISTLLVEFAADAKEAAEVEKVIQRGRDVIRGACNLAGFPQFPERTGVVAVPLEHYGSDGRPREVFVDVTAQISAEAELSPAGFFRKAHRTWWASQLQLLVQKHGAYQKAFR